MLFMIQITATDLKANLGKYLLLAQQNEIFITKNGKGIAVLTHPKEKRSWVDEITGIIPDADIDIRKTKMERLSQKYESLD